MNVRSEFPLARPVCSRWLEPLTALVLLNAPFMGMFPANVAVVLCGLVCVRGLRAERRVANRAVMVLLLPLCVFVVSRLVSALLSDEVAVGLRAVAKDWRFFVLLACLAGVLNHHSRWKYWIAAGALANAVYGALIHFGVDLVWTGLPQPMEPGMVRTGSFVRHPMTEGGLGMLAVLAPLVLRLRRHVSAVFILSGVTMLMISETRSAILGAGVGLLVYGWIRGVSRRRLLMVGLLMVAAMMADPGLRERIVHLPDEFHSRYRPARRRLMLWDAALRSVPEHPALGAGPGRFRTVAAAGMPEEFAMSHAHNVPLHLVAETGLVGLISWLWLVAASALMLSRSPEPTVRAGGLAVLTGFLAQGMLELNFYDGEVATLFFALLGHALYRSVVPVVAEDASRSDEETM